MADWKVYSDPLDKGQILMGYKGATYMDSGYFYAPYIPITNTPVVLDPDTSIPKRGILTRYGKKLLDAGKSAVEGWTVKTKKKKVWRDINEPWEISQVEQYYGKIQINNFSERQDCE